MALLQALILAIGVANTSKTLEHGLAILTAIATRTTTIFDDGISLRHRLASGDGLEGGFAIAGMDVLFHCLRFAHRVEIAAQELERLGFVTLVVARLCEARRDAKVLRERQLQGVHHRFDGRLLDARGREWLNLAILERRLDLQLLECTHIVCVLIADNVWIWLRVLDVAMRWDALEMIRSRTANAPDHHSLLACVFVLAHATTQALVSGTANLTPRLNFR